jgi:hypothetical protein
MSKNLENACTKANALPSGKLVENCNDDSCRPAWIPIDAEVQEILHLPNKSADELKKRNRRISAAYAKLFLSQAPDGASTTVRFIGAAAFGSKQVGCAMNSMAMKTSLFGLTDKMGIDEIPITPPIMEFNRMAEGNAAIFESFYPASRFYAENIDKRGKDWVMRCLEERYPPDQLTGRSAPVVEGLRLISEGKLKDGVMTIVRHEQGKILEETMYNIPKEEIPGNNALFALTMNSAILFGQFEAVYSAGCVADVDKYIVEYPHWSISLESRMDFFEQSVDKFNQLWTSEKDYITRELKTISGFAR